MSDTQLATLDDSYLAELQGMVDKQQMGSHVGPAVLKINYEANAAHERGVWVVGQQKKDNEITEQGKKAKGLIVLTTRFQYSVYDKKNTQNNYTSMMFTEGTMPPDKAAAFEKATAAGLEKPQHRIVVFGLAVCEDGEEVPCVAYMKGMTWKPFFEHHKKITQVRGSSGVITVPPYTFYTNFGTPETEQNGSNIYYIGVFNVGFPMPPDKARSLYSKAEEVHAFIDESNRRKQERIDKNRTAAPVMSAPPVSMPQYSAGEDAFIEPEYQVSPTQPVPAAPANPAPAAPADSMADLEAEINAIL